MCLQPGSPQLSLRHQAPKTWRRASGGLLALKCATRWHARVLLGMHHVHGRAVSVVAGWACAQARAGLLLPAHMPAPRSPCLRPGPRLATPPACRAAPAAGTCGASACCLTCRASSRSTSCALLPAVSLCASCLGFKPRLLHGCTPRPAVHLSETEALLVHGCAPSIWGLLPSGAGA